ncbi:MAG: hypothetical protein ACI9JM_002556 [Halioglobus sp.]
MVNDIALDTVEKTVDISFRRGATDLDGLECGGDYGMHEIPFDGVTEPGKYRFNFYSEGFKSDPENLFDPDRLGHSFDLYVQDEPITHWQEVPYEGARQSGVGLVRGWVCNADLVEVQFDDGKLQEEELQEVAYGSSRSDTRPICGDSDNGFSMALA